MALYQKITITEAGAELISGIVLNGGTPLTFEAVAVGSGELAEGATPAKFTGLIQEAKRLPIETVSNEGGIITVTARLATDTITADLYHREIGVYANGILLAYGNTGDKYDYIPAAGNNAAVQKIIRVPLAIGTMQHTFAEMDTTDLVTHAALEARIKTVVEPAVRDIFTEDLADAAFEQAARVVAREVAEEVNADAYAAQVKAETAAAEALVSEANIKKVANIVEHADIVWDVNKMFGNSTDTYREFYAISALRQYFYEIDVANGDTDPATGFNYSKKFMVPGLKIRYLRGVSNGYIPDPFWCTTTWTGGNIDWSWVPGIETVTDDFSNPKLWTDDVPMNMMDLHLDSESTDSNGVLALHVTPEEKAKWNTPLNAYQLFKGQQITAIPGEVNLTKTLFAYQMCWDCKHLTSIAGLKMPCVMNTYQAFSDCTELADISDTAFSLSLNCAYMFANCPSLKTVGNANFSGAENCGEMFLNCPELTTTGTSTFRHLRFAESMFAGCGKLEDITSMNLTRLTSAQSMFSQCILNLASIKHMAFYINQVAAAPITIGINIELKGNSELEAALESIRSRGWIVLEEYNVKTA